MNSRKAIFINSCRPKQTFRILRLEGNEGSVYKNIFDHYENRPENLIELSLIEFAVRYKTVSGIIFDEESRDEEMQYQENISRSSCITLKNGKRMRQRMRAAVLRHRYYTIDGDRAAFFYSLIVCHVPFRKELELIQDGETVERCV